ncbi:unnamed protein product, partial [marine sediment metagenome]
MNSLVDSHSLFIRKEICESLKNRGILPIDQPLDIELISDKKLVVGTKDMQITPHQVGLDFDDYDILVIPGGKGVDTIIQNQDILDKVKIF